MGQLENTGGPSLWGCPRWLYLQPSQLMSYNGMKIEAMHVFYLWCRAQKSISLTKLNMCWRIVCRQMLKYTGQWCGRTHQIMSTFLWQCIHEIVLSGCPLVWSLPQPQYEDFSTGERSDTIMLEKNYLMLDFKGNQGLTGCFDTIVL
jgi:hypothetical protein